MSVLSKRLLTAVSIVLVVAMTASAAIAAPAVVTDVPGDHWAYEAVTLLVNKGYMGVYESGQFRGDDNVSRYLLAFVAARLLRDVESGRTTLTDDDMRVVRELSVNLREQLAVVTGRLSQLEKAAADAASDAAIAREDVARGAAGTKVLQAELAAKTAAIEEQIKQIKDDAAARASAGDQKLTALYADSKQQMVAGDEAVRQELAQQLAVAQAKADSVQASALAAVAGEAKSRQDLESRLSLSIDGLKAADEAQKAQIGQLSLKLDDAVAAIASARAMAEAAIANEAAARQNAVASLEIAQRELAESMRASLGSGLDAERTAREKDMADLRAGLASLTAIQDDMAESSALALGAAVETERRERAAADIQLKDADDKLRLSLDQLGGRVTALEEAVTRRISSEISQVNVAIEAERAARDKDVAGLAAAVDRLASDHDALNEASATKDALSQAADALSAKVDAERAARQEEVRGILAELAKARGEIADLDRKTAEADAAIIAGLEVERARIGAVAAELQALTQAVSELEQYSQTIEGGLKELGKKQGSDYNQQRQALMDLQVALDKLSKTLSDKIAANAAEDVRTGAKVVENAMDIRKVVDALNETRQALNANVASTKEAHAAIAEVNTTIEGLNKRLASMELMLQGSVDELRRRFADDLVAERWEAEAREVKLQSMIEELQARVDRLEGQKASQPTGTMGSGAIIGVLAVVAAIVAAIALGAGGGGN
jgi:hypothetical protein